MKILFLSFFYLFLTILLNAQNDTLKSELNEIVITANKHEVSLFKTASSVSIITNEEIAYKQSSSVIDLLHSIPGITVSQQGGPGKLASIFMRGANSNFVLVMVDNVEVNDPSSTNNAYDFSSLQVSDIERIEIIRGPQSTLYGSEATAGIIHILTKSGQGKPGLTVRGETGTNSFYNGSISSKGEISGLNYFINFSRLQTDAVSAIEGENFETDGFTNNSGFLKVGYGFSKKIRADFTYKLVDSKTALDQAMKNGDDPNFNSNLDNQLISLNIYAQPIEDLWESKLRGSFFIQKIKAEDKVDEINPLTLSKSNYLGERISFDWQNNFNITQNNVITFGVDYKNELANSTYHSESMFGNFDSNFPEKQIGTTGIYIQDFISYTDFSTTIGFRYDKNEKFGSVTTFRIAPIYFFKSLGTRIKGTYGSGFKAPSLYSLFAPFYGNENLKPERSTGWDVGFEQYFSRGNLSFGATYFSMSFKDMIGFNENFQSININEAETKGLETFLSLKNLYSFNFDVNYTYNETYDKSDLSKDQLIRRPKNQFSCSFRYNINKFNIGLSLKHSGEKYDEDFSIFPAERITLNAYTLIDISASYNLFEYLKIFGRIENITDEEYEDILYYGNLGRSGYLGFELNL